MLVGMLVGWVVLRNWVDGGFGVNWEWVGCFYGEDGIFIIFIIFYISCCRYGIYFIVCKRCDGEYMYYIKGLEIVKWGGGGR